MEPPPSPSKPIVELRQYQLHPSQSSFYAQRVQTSPLRDGVLPLAFFGVVETGAIPLHTAVHMYHYPGGHAERSEKRSALSTNGEWNEYLGEVRPCMMQHSSGTYVEADFVKDLDGVAGLKRWVDAAAKDEHRQEEKSGSGCLVELRKYQLKLGYSTNIGGDILQAFLQMQSHSLPSRLEAEGVHHTTQLVTVLVGSVGNMNTVYEVWKHGGRGEEDAEEDCCGWKAMEQSSLASGGTTEWRMVLAELVESVDTTVVKPLEFSPMR